MNDTGEPPSEFEITSKFELNTLKKYVLPLDLQTVHLKIINLISVVNLILDSKLLVIILNLRNYLPPDRRRVLEVVIRERSKKKIAQLSLARSFECVLDIFGCSCTCLIEWCLCTDERRRLGQARQSHRRPDQRCWRLQRKLCYSLATETLIVLPLISSGTWFITCVCENGARNVSHCLSRTFRRTVFPHQ
ncbi:hypothetical protein AGLY_006501 [Aphis glycines]|uniref:Uncharacterized protein n=1 Tax=Aphis glycines TaxID=307491 RepID=A0A6G0TSJ0_APHGL|nr:hypothetical protein AGLY_006501 [Aphis glycines]